LLAAYRQLTGGINAFESAPLHFILTQADPFPELSRVISDHGGDISPRRNVTSNNEGKTSPQVARQCTDTRNSPRHFFAVGFFCLFSLRSSCGWFPVGWADAFMVNVTRRRRINGKKIRWQKDNDTTGAIRGVCNGIRGCNFQPHVEFTESVP
jgi:hypothetical protein